MSYMIFRMGPLASEPDAVSAYMVYPGKPEQQVFLAGDDGEALKDIVAVYSPDELACEPQLAEAALPWGITSRELTEDESIYSAIVALEYAFPDRLGQAGMMAIHHLASASEVFYRASPWTATFARRTIGVSFTGDVRRRTHGRILGGTGSAPGIALYAGTDPVEQIVRLYEDGRMQEAANIDTLGVTLETSPAFALQAMQRAYGLSGVPTPLKLESGQQVELNDLDLLTLSTALRAVSVLSEEDRESEAQINMDDVEVWAMAYLP